MVERTFHNSVPVDNLDSSAAISNLGRILQNTTYGNHIVTLGIAKYIETRKHEDFRNILHKAVLVIPESTGLFLYSRIHPPNLVNTPGGQLARDCLTACAELGKTVAVFGASEFNRRRSIEVIKREDSRINIVDIPGEYLFSNPDDSQYVAETLDKIALILL